MNNLKRRTKQIGKRLVPYSGKMSEAEYQGLKELKAELKAINGVTYGTTTIMVQATKAQFKSYGDRVKQLEKENTNE